MDVGCGGGDVGACGLRVDGAKLRVGALTPAMRVADAGGGGTGVAVGGVQAGKTSRARAIAISVRQLRFISEPPEKTLRQVGLIVACTGIAHNCTTLCPACEADELNSTTRERTNPHSGPAHFFTDVLPDSLHALWQAACGVPRRVCPLAQPVVYFPHRRLEPSRKLGAFGKVISQEMP